MAVSYDVKAEVIDIRSDTPKESDAFLVDTNVWYWMTYTRASQGPNPPWPNQIKDYPGYLKQALAAKSRVLRCNLSLSELAHRIEATERGIFEAANPALGQIRAKEFRHNHTAARATVVSEVQVAWGVVKTMAAQLDTSLGDTVADAALNRFQNEPLDGYDLFILEAMKAARVVQVLTDDGDYCTVPGIQVFTANRNVVTAASAQSKLLTR